MKAGEWTLHIGRKFTENANAQLGDFTKEIALELYKRVIDRSPVGNPDHWQINIKRKRKRGDPGFVGKGYVGGRFRRNWQISLHTPKTTSVLGLDPSGEATIAEGELVLAQMKEPARVYIVNNLSYAWRLENGWSPSARRHGGCDSG
ncbi:MAG: hypothetical protein KF735_08595 [Chelatococcus sp.]|uniref:hypothetical protein n=1 Tax=Chelatococcus sp. TaxID=1953771 RepID=UPI0025B975BF|nr:hypothetical protein [Chelatococcus sp.]MBX3537682.1 hypothetical protein [Chelatococcus sp.]